MPSYNVKSGDSTVLAQKINATQTTGIIAAPMNINGAPLAWANTAGGVAEITEQSDSTLKREWFYYTGGSTDANNNFTFSGVVRGVARDTTDVTSGGTGTSFSKGATVRFVTFHDLLNKKANLDRANTWSAAQTVSDTVKWLFGGVGNWIRGDGGDLKFKDANNAETTLSQLTAGAGVDTKVLVSSNDTTAGFLNGKLVVANGIAFTENNDGSNETLSIGTRLDANGGLEFNSGEQRVKLPAGSGLTHDSTGLYITSSAFVPTGAMSIWTTDTAPTGWLLCYGQAVSRTTYSTLFGVISTTYGAGDASTTFNVPDMRGRIPLGQDDMGGSSANRVTASAADSLNGNGGEENHQLTINELAIHSHNVGGGTNQTTGGSGEHWVGNTSSQVSGAAGGDEAHNNMQPYLTLNYIIKI